MTRRPSPGTSVAQILAGAWRAEPPLLDVSPVQLAAVVPALLETGGAGLAWWRLRGTALAALPDTDELHHAWRLQALHAEVRASGLARLWRLLRGSGIEAILGKGWAIARRYPDLALRPYGDYDLYVRSTDEPRAAALLAHTNAPIDLHSGFAEIDDRDADALFARSQLVELDGEPTASSARKTIFGFSRSIC